MTLPEHRRYRSAVSPPKIRTLLFVLVWSVACHAGAQESRTVDDRTRDAYSQPFPTMATADREQFLLGRGIFQRSWVVAPALDTAFDGLGPLHSRLACQSCHQRNGRGLAPANSRQRLQTMLVRLSVTGQGSHGEPLPHPVYGDQLHEEGVPGVMPEGRVSVEWQEHDYTFADGETVSLRRPQLSFNNLAYGNLTGVEASPRVGPPAYGMGLLQTVADSVLIALANDKKSDGVGGVVNEVYDPLQGKMTIGRFGYKASVHSLRGQVTKAMSGDLGISSLHYPQQNCSASQQDCLAAATGGEPEITEEQLDAVAFYLANIAVPAPRDTNTLPVQTGRKIFRDSGCAICHREQLPLPVDYPHAQTIAPYTDLLIHDMGQGLADGGSEYLASPQHWRTAPLWGLGLSSAITESEQYLHDGRARNLTEAILWHGGEAQIARDRFAELPPSEREALLTFLRSL